MLVFTTLPKASGLGAQAGAARPRSERARAEQRLGRRAAVALLVAHEAEVVLRVGARGSALAACSMNGAAFSSCPSSYQARPMRNR